MILLPKLLVGAQNGPIAQGVRSRPISSNIWYPIGQVTVSHLFHSQLIDAVNKHVQVLRDSLSLNFLLEVTTVSPHHTIFLTFADVAVLYPSLN